VARTVGAAEAKARLGALLGGVFYRGERYIIERRGHPVAALVPVHELAQQTADDARFNAFLTLVGGWSDVDDAEIDAVVSDIYAARASDHGRTVSLGQYSRDDRERRRKRVRTMTEQPTSLLVRGDQPLVGVVVHEGDQEFTRYSTDDGAADVAGIERALALAGAWADLDWDEAEAELDRIRHESQPTPPITDL
jgi:prevent-host-death family protein